VVLAELISSGPATAPELAARTGLSKPTVASALRSLQNAGLVDERGLRPGQPGQAPVVWGIDKSAGVVLSVDVGTQWVRLALTRLDGERAATWRERAASPSAGGALAALDAGLERVLAGAGLALGAVVFTVVGSPGVVRPESGVLEHASNLPGWGEAKTLEALRARFGADLLVMKDVYLASLGEAHARQDQGQGDFVLFSVGRGVGAGVVHDGQPLSGAHGLAGEIAFLPLAARAEVGSDHDGPSPRGALEEAASADAMLAQAADAGARFGTVAELMEAARAGSPVAGAVVQKEAGLVAFALSAFAVIMDPPLIVLAGSVGLHGGAPFAEAVRAQLQSVLPFAVPPVEVSLAGEDAILDGGAEKALQLAWEKLAFSL
jgi:predicted NBD/HSP70 family sugar kinase